MQLTIRMLPHVQAAYQSISTNGRAYRGQPGQTLDVPDFDAAVLAGNGWARVGPVGTTAQRPVANGQSPRLTDPYNITPGFQFMDTTLGKIVVWDGQNWRDPSSGSVA